MWPRIRAETHDLGIYTLIVFGILLFILGKFAWGPVMSGLDKREATLARHMMMRRRPGRGEALAEVQARLAKTRTKSGPCWTGPVAMPGGRTSLRPTRPLNQAERDRFRRESTQRKIRPQQIYQQSVMLAR